MTRWQFYAFDILGEQWRGRPQVTVQHAQDRPVPLLARRVDGIFLSDFEQGEIGPDLFRHDCLMG
jgi:bifunctional non-homologous end joining protein LigD